MGKIRSAIENRDRYAEDGTRLASLANKLTTGVAPDGLAIALTEISGRTPWTISTTELPDAYVTAITSPGEDTSRFEVIPKDVSLDGLAVILHGSRITDVNNMRLNTPEDRSSGSQTLPVFTGGLVNPIDALRYGASDAPAIIDSLFTKLDTIE